MKKIVLILLAILMVTCLAFGFAACKSECDKGNHVWDDGTVTTPATCTTKGVKTYRCTLCDHGEMTEEIDMLAHTPVNASVAATCTTAGVSNATKCSVCGTAIAAGTKIDPLGHSVTTWRETADVAKHEGTCTRTGCGATVTADHVANEAGTACKDCGKELVCTHSRKTHNDDPATCTTAKVEHWSCPDCDWTKDETVGNPLGHSFDGVAWKVDATTGKHYQECKRSGCTVHNDNEHDAAFGDYITTDATNHYKKCAKCTLRTEEGEHDHTASQIAGNSTQHAVACSVCHKQFDNVDHTSVTVEGKSATCTEAGKQDGSKCSVCNYVLTEGAVINPLGHSYTGAKWVISETEGMHERTCVREGCGFVDKAAHTWDDEHWGGNAANHWHDCTVCPAVKDSAPHDFGDEGRDLVCNVSGCGSINPSSEFNYVVSYTLDGEQVRVGYVKLADALHDIGANQNIHSATITVKGDGDDNVLNGLGVVIPENHNITIDLKGATYVVASEPVGSTGTVTCGFQILKGSNVTIKNGTITSTAGSGVKMLIQNYADLTLNGVTLDGRNLDQASVNYTLSNNCGNVVIKGESEIIAREQSGVAFDLWYNMGNWYPQGVSVTVDDTSTITGVIEYGSAQAGIDDLTGKATLVLPEGNYTIRYSGNANCDSADITIGNVALTHNYGDWTMVTDSTCTAEGEEKHTCALCGKVETRAIEKKAHVWDSGVVTKKAECEADGEKLFTCTTCPAGNKATKTEVISKTGHTMYYVLAGNQHKQVCANCDRSTAPEGHTNVDGECSVCKFFLTSFDVTDYDTLDATAPNSGYTDEKYFVIGKILTIGDPKYNTQVTIVDEEDREFVLYGILNHDGTVRYADAKNGQLITDTFAKDDIIVAYGVLGKYEGKAQLKDVWIVQHKAQALTNVAKLALVPLELEFERVDADFDLPTLEGVEIEWTVTGAGLTVAGSKATLARTAEDQDVTLTATVTVDGITATKDFAVTVIAQRDDQKEFTMQHSWTGNATNFSSTDNNAEVAGLDATWFNIESAKNSTNFEVGVNKDGTFRLYCDKTNGNGTQLNITLTKNSWKIKSITVNLGGTVTKLQITAGTTELYNNTPTTGSSIKVTVDGTSVTLKNIFKGTTSPQVYITSIVILCEKEICLHEDAKLGNLIPATEASCEANATIAHYECACGDILNESKEVIKTYEIADTATDHDITGVEYTHVNIEGVWTHYKVCKNGCGIHQDEAPCTVEAIAATSQTCTQPAMTAGSKCQETGAILVAPVATGSAAGHDLEYVDNEDGTHMVSCNNCDDEDVNKLAESCTAKNNIYVHDGNEHWLECFCGAKIASSVATHTIVDGKCTGCPYEQGLTAADVSFVVYNTVKDENKKLSNDLIKELAANLYVNKPVTFKVDSNYRVISVIHTDDEVNETALEADDDGLYTFTATSEDVVEVIVIRVYQVSVTIQGDSGVDTSGISVSALLDSKTIALPATVDEKSQISLAVAGLGTDRIITAASYTVNSSEGGSISIGTDKTSLTGTVPVNGIVVITVTVANKPNKTLQTLTLDFTVTDSNAIASNLGTITNTATFDAQDITFEVKNVQRYTGSGNYLMLKSSESYIANTTAIPGSIVKVEVYTTSGASASATYYVEITSAATLSVNKKGTTLTGKAADTPITATANEDDNKCYFNVTQASSKNGQIAKIVISYYD